MEESQREWESDMHREANDRNAALTLRLVRRTVRNWPIGPPRDLMMRDWYFSDHLERALMITGLQVARTGLTPEAYASELLIAYIKKYC